MIEEYTLDIIVAVILVGTFLFSAWFWYRDWNEKQALKRRKFDDRKDDS